jgi:Putative Flp pilus-assembly TadE/G-like
MDPKRDPQRASGQILILFALGFTALLAATAFVIDGGNAMAQLRATQNGVDAASEAGTVVIAQSLVLGSVPVPAGACPLSTTDPWDLAVCKAVYGTGAANNVSMSKASYTSWNGSPIGDVGAGSVPAGAQGVQAFGSRTFDTLIARAIGLSQFTASARATSVTGVVTTICPPGSSCALLPLTIPQPGVSVCQTNGTLVPGTGDWPFLGDAQTDVGNEAIVPICKNKTSGDIGGDSAGSVGWIDYSTAIGASTNGSCGNKILDQVETPCVVSLSFPTWVQTFAGGVGQDGPAIQTAIDKYHYKVVGIPLFDGTCKVKPTGIQKGDCPFGQDGVGANTWYWIPTFANFKLDYSYLAGVDRKSCGNAPGSPLMGGNGSDACLKGWFVTALTLPGSIQLGPVPDSSTPLGVLLIK